MFTYVRLKNFKSLGDVVIDLTDRKGDPKHIVFIYGENGIGKSNLASSFYMLQETLRTMNIRDFLEKLLEHGPENISSASFKDILKTQFKDTETIIQNYKMIDSSEPMLLEFGFKLASKAGKYTIETDNAQLIHEKLEYVLLKNKGTYFDLTPGKLYINPRIVEGNEAYTALTKACEKFWGKHTLLSIILHETDDKSEQFIKSKISVNFQALLDFFMHLSCNINAGSQWEENIGLPGDLPPQLDRGIIPANRAAILRKVETTLTNFFKATYTDIKRAYYNTTEKDSVLRYQLKILKTIYGKDREIDISLESTGTRAVIKQLPFILSAINSNVSIIDEIDAGMHDKLIQNLVNSLKDSVPGQLIMTSHNTALMESELPKECFYVINELADGNKELKCITEYDPKINIKTNIRNRYHAGTYSGLPKQQVINYKKLAQMIRLN